MTTECDEGSPAPKVVNWDVAEEKEFEKLKSEMDKYKDKIIELDSKADDLRSKLDKKVELSKANTTSGVTVVALEYKRVTLNIKTLFDKKWASIKPRDDVFSTFSFMKSCFIPKQQEILDWRDVMDEIYDEFDETIKNLGQEGWTLRSINNRANRVVEHYFSRPL